MRPNFEDSDEVVNFKPRVIRTISMSKIQLPKSLKYIFALFSLAVIFFPIIYQAYGVNYPIQASILKTEIERKIAEPLTEPLYKSLIAASRKSTLADQGDALFLFGEYHRQRGRFEKAIAPLKDCLAIREKFFGSDSPVLIEVLESLEDCLQRTYDNSRAVSVTEREIHLYQKPINQNSAGAYADAAVFALELGAYDIALKHFRKADEYYIQLRSQARRKLLYQRLNAFLKQTKKNVSADLKKFAGLKLPEEEKSNSAYIFLLNRIQRPERKSSTDEKSQLQKVVTKGDADLQQALLESDLVPWKVVRAGCLDALGDYNCSRGRLLALQDKNDYAMEAFRLAENYYVRAQADYLKELEPTGKKNPLLADSLQKLQNVYINLCDWKNALICAEKRAQLFEIPENPSVGIKTSKLALIFSQNCEFTKAKQASAAALNIFRSLHDLNWQAMELQNWAETLKLEGKYDEAEEKLLQALNLREQSGIDHVSTALVTLKMGQLFALMSRPLESKLFTERTQRLRRLGFPIDHPYVAYGKEIEAAGMLAEVEQDLSAANLALSEMTSSTEDEVWKYPLEEKSAKDLELKSALKRAKAIKTAAKKTCAKARSLIKEAIPVVVREHGPDSRKAGETMLLLARSFEIDDLQSNKHAIKNLLVNGNTAIEKGCRRTPNHIAVARAKQRLGKFYSECRDTQRAEIEFLKAIGIYNELFPSTPHPEMAQLIKDYSELNRTCFEKQDTTSSSSAEIDNAEALLRLSYAFDKQTNQEGSELRWNSFLYWADEKYKELFPGETELLASKEGSLDSSWRQQILERLLNREKITTEDEGRKFEALVDRNLQNSEHLIGSIHPYTPLWFYRAALLRASSAQQRFPIIARLLKIRDEARDQHDEYLMAVTALDIARALKIQGHHDTYWTNTAKVEFLKLLSLNLERENDSNYLKLVQRDHLIKCITCAYAFEASENPNKSLKSTNKLIAQISSTHGIESGYLDISELLFRLSAFSQARLCLGRIIENPESGLNEKALAAVLASKVETSMMHTDAAINFAQQAISNARFILDAGIESDARECLSEALEQEGDRLLDQSILASDTEESSRLEGKAKEEYKKALSQIYTAEMRLIEGRAQSKPLQSFSRRLQTGELLIKSSDLQEGKEANDGFTEARRRFVETIDHITEEHLNTNPWRILCARAHFGKVQAELKRDGIKNLRDCEVGLFKASDLYSRDESASSLSALCNCFSLLAAAYLSDGNKSRAAEQIFRSLNICEKGVYPRLKDMSTVQKCVFSRFLGKQNDLLIDACSDEKAGSKDVPVAIENINFAIKHFAKVQSITFNTSNQKSIPMVADFEVANFQSRMNAEERLVDIIKFRKTRFPQKTQVGFAYLLVARNKNPILRKLSIEGKELLNKATAWEHEWFTDAFSPDLESSIDTCKDQLSAMRSELWSEIERNLDASRRLFLCVDSSLGPIAWRLVVNSKDLYETKLKTEMCELNVLSDMLVIRRKYSAKGQDLIVGDISFSETDEIYPYLDDKIESVVSLYDKFCKKKPTLLLHADAKKTNVVKQLSTARSVLISSHGDFLDETSVEAMASASSIDPFDRSCLVLLSDEPKSSFEYLKASEILNIDMSNCDLVTLSACSTGKGKEIEYQGILGLRSAFLLAKAKCALVSLCPVNKNSTTDMMNAFYLEVLDTSKRSRTNVEALFDAQTSVWQNTKFKHPFYWANWTVVGNGW